MHPSIPSFVSDLRRRPWRAASLGWPLLVLGVLASALFSSCALQLHPEGDARGYELRAELDAEAAATDIAFDPDEASLAALSTPAASTEAYRIGPGDEIWIDVPDAAEIGGTRKVGPDGRIALSLVGVCDLSGRTRVEAAAHLQDRLRPFFEATPDVVVDVRHYANNKVFVLGRVESPGVVELSGSGSLLQVLSEAGGLPVREFRSFLARCAVIRGRNEILWIDLLELLRGGNLALNVPLRNGDVVYVPDSEDTLVFVMGEVETPGAVPIKARLDLMQALARSGGPTEDADLSHVWLIRDRGLDENGERLGPVRVDVARMLEQADFTANCQLRSGDVLYVSRSGFGDVSYVLRTLGPALNAISIAAALTRSD